MEGPDLTVVEEYTGATCKASEKLQGKHQVSWKMKKEDLLVP